MLYLPLTPALDIKEIQAAIKGADKLHAFCKANSEEILAGSIIDTLAALATILSEVDYAICAGKVGEALVDVLSDSVWPRADG